MRIAKISALLLALVFLFCACAGVAEGESYASTHVCVYGAEYETAPKTCLDGGRVIRYCKICHRAESFEEDIERDPAERRHDSAVDYLAATEKDAGYYHDVCPLCNYVNEHVDYRPLYALFETEGTMTGAPAGVSGLLISDTETHDVLHQEGRETVADAEFARRLAVALTIAERLLAEDAVHTPDTLVTVSEEMLAGTSVTTHGVYVGATLSAKKLLGLWLLSGNPDTMLCLANLVGETEATLLAAVNERIDRLGAAFTTASLRDPDAFSGVTVYGTSVLLAKSLDVELLCELLSTNVNPYIEICGVRPAVYFETPTLRVSALNREGNYTFLVLAGDAIPGGLENTLYVN